MDETFTNEPIAVDHLPQLDDDAFVSVDSRHVWGTLVGLIVTIVVALAAGSFWASQVDSVVVPAIITAVVVSALAAAAMFAWIEARRLAYQLRERDLSFRSGVISRRVETIPFSRVQHVSVGRGAIERMLGLSTLTVSSAGPDIAVPGLAPDDAERIKGLVAERAGAVDADESDDARTASAAGLDDGTGGISAFAPPNPPPGDPTPGRELPPPVL